MKSFPSSTSLHLAVLLGLAALLTACGGGKSGDAVKSIGPVENAHIHVYMNVVDFLDSNYVQQTRARLETNQQAAITDNFDELKEATGVDFREISGVMLSANLDGIDFANPTPEPIRNMSAMAALGFKSALTMDQVHAVLNLMVEDSNGGLSLDTGNVGGQEIRLITVNNQPDAPKIHVTLAPDNKTVIATLNAASLESALNRAKSGRNAPQTGEMTTALRGMSGKQYQALLILPEQLRQVMRAQIQEAQAMDPMAGAMIGPFQQMSAAMLSANAGNNLDLSFNADLGSEEAANQLVSQITTFKPMMTMSMQGQGVDGLLNVVQSITPKADGTLAGISLTLTPEATETLVNDMMQIMMMRMMGGGF